VDASLLGLAVPYQVVSADDPIMLKTAKHIESTILRDGGVHRYDKDSYYGGGGWILLTAWLGWYYVELTAKCPERAAELATKIQACHDWIESHAGRNQYLPEQIPENLNVSYFYPIWVERWGEIASPLLWSHANYIILRLKKSAWSKQN
jgi:GH15 family glucan-1,4-alpha-glucosidase